MGNILKIIGNDSTKDFAKDLVSMGAQEILKNYSEIASGFPIISGIVAIWKTGLGIHDAFLLKDLANFYYGVYESIPVEDKLLSKIAEEGHASDLLAEFTLRLISTNNKPDQTRVLGWLFYAVAANEITEEEYMRLCVYVHDCFANDIRRLKEFKGEGANKDFITDSFFRAGLLDMKDIIWTGGTICTLSLLGTKFYQILNSHGFFD